jgi:hypothetical protein
MRIFSAGMTTGPQIGRSWASRRGQYNTARSPVTGKIVNNAGVVMGRLIALVRQAFQGRMLLEAS